MPTRATLAARERRSDAAWETSRARFALSREAFREAVAQRQKKNDETETTKSEDDMGADMGAASYSVQTPGGTTSLSATQKKKMSRLGVAGAEGGALALAAAAARRFALPGDTDTDSDGASSASDEHEWLFREEKLST